MAASPHTQIILGIDPGLNNTGWGVISKTGNALSFIAGGVIVTKPKTPDAERLAHIHTELSAIIQQYSPAAVAVEEVFVNNNARSSLKLGQARGIALLAGALAGCTVAEYAALKIKQAVVGYGRADKTQVAHMVKILLPTSKVTKADTADALAVAITHAHAQKHYAISA